VQLAQQVGGAAGAVDAALVEVRSEVGELGGGVGQQVEEDDQDGALQRDQGLGLGHAFDQPPVAFAEEGVGLRGAGGDLGERGFEVGVASAGAGPTGLAPGLHTFSIEVTHERGQGTDGSWVWIDAFDIAGTPVAGGISAGTGRVEQNNPAMTYLGHWYANNNPMLSGGSAALAVDAGSRASLSFTGSGVSWITYEDQWSGVARVYIDGELKTTVDEYAAPARIGVAAYTISGLGAGTHTITIEATGSRNASSQGAWVWIDGFDVTP